ncbi:MAG: DUF4358 domain-containing protein [Faecousia sp.]
MKRTFAWILAMALLLGLTGCGGANSQAAEQVDLNGVYEGMEATLPEMFVMDETTMLNYLGIRAEDCQQVVTAVANDGLRADEVWLIEAKDQESLDRLKTLAQTRLEAKADETVLYSPEQYAVVEKAELFTQGMYLVLLVSPDVESLKADVEAAVQ